MTDQQSSLSATRYRDSSNGYRETFSFPSVTYQNHQVIARVQSTSDFDQFTLRENSLCVVFFAHSQDPAMERILQFLNPLASVNTKLLVVDVAILKDLRDRFDIRGPTLLKVYKGKVMNRFNGKFNPESINMFISTPSTVRWRSVDAR